MSVGIRSSAKTMTQAQWAGKVFRGTLGQGVMLVFVGMTILPLWFMITAAFKSDKDYALHEIGPPLSPTLHNFHIVFASGFFTWLGNSVILSSVAIGASLGCGLAGAFAVVFMEFRGRRALFNGVVSLMAVAPVILVVPLFVSIARLGLIDSRLPVIVIYTAILIPQSFFLLSSFLRTVPLELIDAAVLDGCKGRDVLRRIVLPLSAPALVTLALANAVFAWNELLIALIFLPSEGRHTLMVGLASFATQYSVEVPVVMSGLGLAAIPMILFYGAGQRYFVEGLMGGGLKQ
jgi:ABC-type glycerol-3-phosphate transport system permease component